MKKTEILTGLSLLMSATAIVIAFNTVDSGPETVKKGLAGEDKLQAFVDERIARSTSELRVELVDRLDGIITSLDLHDPDEPLAGNFELSELAQKAKHDPNTARLLQAAIESVILREWADELESAEWLDKLSREKLQQLFNRTAQTTIMNGINNFQTPVDVSDIDSIDGQVSRILKEFEGVNSYYHNNALVKQIVEMGDEAIVPLLSTLAEQGIGTDWAKKNAVTDALEKLLTEEHEELIVAEFTRSGALSSLIKKYQFPAAEEEVMNKIMRPHNGHVNRQVIDAALQMNAERSIPLLIEHVNYGQNVSYAAAQLAAEGIDITAPLRMATGRAQNAWEKASLVELCLERDMPEGYDLAIQVLRSNDLHAEHSQEQVYQYIRKYTGINGSYAEVADWLQTNKPD